MPASEKAQLQEMAKRLDMPTNVEDILEHFQSYRDYQRDVMLRDDEDTVTTNLIYRNLSATLAQLLPTDPTVAFQPKRKLPRLSDPATVAFGETNEILLNELATMGAWGASFRVLTQAALTVPLVFGKLIWEEDTARDPLGARRFNPELDKIARYRFLRDQDNIQDDSAEHEELRTLEDWIIREQLDGLALDLAASAPGEEAPILKDIETLTALGEKKGLRNISDEDLPEVSTFQGFRIDTVDAEDARWDWDLPNLSKWWEARWMAHRVWLTADEIAARWGLDEDAARPWALVSMVVCLAAPRARRGDPIPVPSARRGGQEARVREVWAQEGSPATR